MLKVILPANVSMIFSYVISVAMFDILDADWTTKYVFTFDYEKQEELQDEILDQMVDLGYETHNQMLNLGSLAIFIVFYFIKVILYLVLYPFRIFSQGLKKLL